MNSDKLQTVKDFTFTVRPYLHQDKEKVRTICCDTGYLGKPVDGIFKDRKWFADFNTNYYLEYEPDSCFVAEVDDEIVGYIAGSKNPLKYKIIFYSLIAIPSLLKAFLKCLAKTYDKKSREYIKRLVFKGCSERVKIPKNTAHFHINVRKGFRIKGVAWALARALFKHFKENNIEEVHAELFFSEKVRVERFYSYWGFKTYDKRPTSILGNKMGKIYMMSITANLDEVKDIWKI